MEGAGKLVLGTVQFGCRYGINSAGRPDGRMVRDILSLAAASGISTLDTSSAYGDSEEVLGACMGEGGFRIVSKYPKGSAPVREMFGASLRKLGCSRLYGYLLHHFEVWKDNPSVWEDFLSLKEEGLVERIGFSLYSPEELEMLLNKGVDFDLLQIPRNIFDRKFDPYLPELAGRGVEVHVRSTFLQGLFFKDRDSLPGKLMPLRRYLVELDRIAGQTGVGISNLALGFNLNNPYVSGVLIGVDNAAQLQANVDASAGPFADVDIDVCEKELLNPVNWN